MYKLVILSTLLVIATARPGYLGHYGGIHLAPAPYLHQEYINVHEPIITKVGAIVESVPSAVSHQSSTVVHSKAHVVTPVLAHGIKTYHTPILKAYPAYASPLIYDFHDHHHHW